MGTVASMRPIRWVLTGILCLSLLGCGVINPRPPRAVVESAIAQRLAQTQVMFDGPPSLSSIAAAAAQVGSVRVTRRDRVQVGGQWALQVGGTYRLKGGSLGMAQRRQARPFAVYLQRDDSQDQWFLLAPPIEEASASSQWRTLPLTPKT